MSVEPVEDDPRTAADERTMTPEEREALAPIEDAVREGEQRAIDEAAGIVPAKPRSVIPAWAKSRDEFRNGPGFKMRALGRDAAYYGLRTPFWYLPRLALWLSWRGAWRLLLWVVRWVRDQEDRNYRASLTASDAASWVASNKLSEDRLRRRLVTVAIVTIGVAVVAGWVLVNAPVWAQLVTLVGALTLLGFAGRDADHPVITTHAGQKSESPPVSTDLILTALDSLGISKLSAAIKADPGQIQRHMMIGRDGPGFRANIELPQGVTAGEVVDKRNKLASGLRRHLSQVWPSGDPDGHEGLLVVWIGDKPMSKMPPVQWALQKSGSVDLFQPFPIGMDPRGRPVTMTLMFASMVIGAVPRMGKSWFLRLLQLAAALDPTSELHLYDLRGGADSLPLEQVAHRFRIGDDEEDIEYLMADLRDLVKERRRRLRTINWIVKHESESCPDGKVTRALADRRDLGLWPILVTFDETQYLFEHEKHGKEAEKLVTDLVKSGPVVGIMCIPCTQRPDDKSLPTSISSSAVLRFCLKVLTWQVNDMVLGGGMHAQGVRATMFTRSDVGVGFFAGEGVEPVIVRAARVDGNDAQPIAARARAARTAAGLLTGHAAGEEFDGAEDQGSDILDHLAEVWPQGEAKVSWETLADRLAEGFPAVYGDTTARAVSEAARAAANCKSVQVGRVGQAGGNPRGMAREDLMSAVAKRHGADDEERLDG